MKHFIDRIAEIICDNNYKLEELSIILPSRRASKYLQRALYNQFQKPLFSPEIFTIDQWVRACSNRTVLDSTRLLFELYHVHQSCAPSLDKGLDEFIKWGRTLLSDFDEIDRYNVANKDLFRNLADIKEIENWSFDTHTPSAAQQRFMEFWDTLPLYYEKLNEVLGTKGLAYPGSVYKEVAENIDLVFQKNASQRFIFAGFNALSPAELSIMKQLKNMGRAEIIFEADAFYFDNPIHEAGRFIRFNAKELSLPSSDFVTNEILSSKKSITVINCTQPTGQAKAASHILAHDIPQNELSQTLLLLGDEKLIVPLLKNIPQLVGKANITLGLPLKSTALRSWTDILFRIQESYQHIKPGTIYHKDFIRFIKHPFIQAAMSIEDKVYAQDMEREILRRNWVFIYQSKLSFSHHVTAIIAVVFQKWTTDYLNVTQLIRKINQQLHDQLQEERYTLENAALFHFDAAIAKLEQVLAEYPVQISLKTYKTVFNQHWTGTSIAYFGNPLDGLQVMGLLETRLLAFKNIIAVGLNDGSMPPVNPIQTFIPMDLRRFHHLPLTSDKQAVFAHHFYRLLPSASNIWITYSSANGAMGMDEQSRYIRQLKFELTGASANIQWNEQFYSIENSEQDNQLVSVEKDVAIQQRLDDYFSRGTSASALKKYIACPLDFYYRYLIGLGEEDTVEEEIEANTLGSFIHETLEHLYEPYSRLDNSFQKRYEHNGPVRPSSIQKMLGDYPPILSNLFKKHFDDNEEFVSSGKNYLSHEMAQHLTAKFLKKELQDITTLEHKYRGGDGCLFIEVVEGQIIREVEVEINGKKKKVTLRGVIDRIDEADGVLRILDYKSGKCESSDVTISSQTKKTAHISTAEFLLHQFDTKKYVFQLLTYNFLYKGMFPHKPYPEKIGIIALNSLEDGPFFLENKLTATMDELMELYEEALILLISSMYSTSVKIEHNAKAMYCNYCG